MIRKPDGRDLGKDTFAGKGKPVLKTILLVSALLFLQTGAASQEVPGIVYEPDTSGLAMKHVRITALPEVLEVAAESSAVANSNRSAEFVLTSADFSKPGPWNSRMVVHDRAAGKAYKIDFLDHASYGVHAEWINDKLIHIREWLGRIVALDMIFDSARGAFIYCEVENYLLLLNSSKGN